MKIFNFAMIVLLLLSQVMAFAQAEPLKTNDISIITLDIDNFWSAYDKLKDCGARNDSILCLQQYLFDKGTEGYREFVKKYSYVPEDYLYAIGKYPGFFKSVRRNTFIVKKVSHEIGALYEKVRTFYPDYPPLKICFVISPLQSGGTSTDRFLFVGAEIITSTKKVDLSGFGDNILGKVLAFETNVRERIINVIAHETVHDLQKNADFNNYELLNRSLIEGAADFVAEYLTGTRANHYLYDYGKLHERELWIKFKNDIDHGANTDDWMYNYDRVNENIPSDLGYYMGYRIVETYYNNSEHKKQAILNIIEMKNPKEFLEKSGYENHQ
jgi:hypothetical protein